MTSFASERFSMVEHQLRGQGITDQAVLAAMGRIPRHRFLDESRWNEAYAPRAVPLQDGQTLSQPFMVALMSQALALRPGLRVLEIGTGSGYQAAVLAEMGARVFSVERMDTLARRARSVLDALGYESVRIRVGDGSLGWPEEAPFDRIVVTAAAPAVPPALVGQLADPGLLVVPVGDRDLQHLALVHRDQGSLVQEEGCACRFVPLVGEEGFAGEA
jgi:protein-L-isoaspartate(D-aspartate) O-methyltransferase